MVPTYTYDEPVFRRAYVVESYSGGATGSMPEQSFEERHEEHNHTQHP